MKSLVVLNVKTEVLQKNTQKNGQWSIAIRLVFSSISDFQLNFSSISAQFQAFSSMQLQAI